jgi:hypothetical protein
MFSFITLYAENILKTSRVYECLGLTFMKEQHGDGPVHLACEQDGQVIEIYPGKDATARSILIGFDVSDLDQTKSRLARLDVVVLKDIAEAAGTRRMIVLDPEGREIYIQEMRPASGK